MRRTSLQLYATQDTISVQVLARHAQPSTLNAQFVILLLIALLAILDISSIVIIPVRAARLIV